MTFVGTAEYLSPEMLWETGHHHGVDWWALGILLYEMIVGIPPFYHTNKKLMYKMILEKNPKFPDIQKHGIYVSADLQDLISKLLTKDMDKRLGSQNDVEEVMSHPFFKDIDI